jgi:cobalamin biosynthesis Co2+ chelatase CbiK
MDYKEIKKMTAGKLREEIAAKFPDVDGVTSMKKEQLVDTLAEKLGIDIHAHAAVDIDKTAIKQKIRALKKERDEALAAHDKQRLHGIRHAIHRQKHTLRRAVKKADAAAAHASKS